MDFCLERILGFKAGAPHGEGGWRGCDVEACPGHGAGVRRLHQQLEKTYVFGAHITVVDNFRNADLHIHHKAIVGLDRQRYFIGISEPDSLSSPANM